MKQLLVSLLQLQKERTISKRVKRVIENKINEVKILTDDEKIFLELHKII